MSDRNTCPHAQSNFETCNIHLQENLELPCNHGTMLSNIVEHKHHMLLKPTLLPIPYPMTKPSFHTNTTNRPTNTQY